ncbi:MAG: tetratricopeptide repeat protein, partial [Bacteroidota bacterium]
MNYIRLLFFISFLPILVEIQAQKVDSIYIQSLIDSLSDQVTSSQTFEQAEVLLNLSEKSNYAFGIGNALIFKGNYLIRTNAYETALSNFQSLYELGEKANREDFINEAYYGFGRIYQGLADFEKAIINFQNCAELSQAIGNNQRLAYSHNALGIIYTRQRSYAQAIDYFLKAKAIFKEKNDTTRLPFLNANIGVAYVELGQAKQALPFFEEVLTTSKALKDTLNFAASYGNLAYTYQNIPDFEKAFTYYDSSLYYSNLMQQDEVTYITYLDLSNAYASSGDFENALLYREKHQSLKEAVLNEQTKAQINELEVQFETAKKERALIAQRKEIDDLAMARQRMVFLIGGLLVSLGMVMFLFFKVRSDKNRKLQLQAAQEELTKTKLKNKELEANQLQRTLKSKEVDLTNLALDIARKNAFSKELIERLEKLQVVEKDKQENQLKDT